MLAKNASDQSDVKLFHKVRRVAVLTYTANGSKLTTILWRHNFTA